MTLSNQELLQELAKHLNATQQNNLDPRQVESIPFSVSTPLVSQATLLKIALATGAILLTLYLTKITISGRIELTDQETK